MITETTVREQLNIEIKAKLRREGANDLVKRSHRIESELIELNCPWEAKRLARKRVSLEVVLLEEDFNKYEREVRA